jgi:hypothetical protein
VADRVNVIEGIIDDIKHGHFPNLIKERGWDAEWKYNKSGMIKNIAYWCSRYPGCYHHDKEQEAGKTNKAERKTEVKKYRLKQNSVTIYTLVFYLRKPG